VISFTGLGTAAHSAGFRAIKCAHAAVISSGAYGFSVTTAPAVINASRSLSDSFAQNVHPFLVMEYLMAPTRA
jgi:hypothetical protein